MKKVILIIIVVIAAAAAIFGGLKLAEMVEARTEVVPEGAGTAASVIQESEQEEELYSFILNGQKYTYNTNLQNYLLIGIDQMETTAEVTDTTEDLCDFILLVSVDQDTGECQLIQFNRDSMVNVYTPYDDGSDGGYAFEQLCYAHGYGGTEEIKCENTVNTLSSLLYDVPIDNYISIAMGGLPYLVDLVGGVTLTINDDFSQTDSDLAQYAVGDVVDMDGDLSLQYVRQRYNVGDTTNKDRMIRQQAFMQALAAKLRENYKEDSSFALEAYMTIADYLVTDCSVDELMDFANLMADTDTSEIVIPDGENTDGETFTEFYIDEDALQELVVNTFFVPVT